MTADVKDGGTTSGCTIACFLQLLLQLLLLHTASDNDRLLVQLKCSIPRADCQGACVEKKLVESNCFGRAAQLQPTISQEASFEVSMTEARVTSDCAAKIYVLFFSFLLLPPLQAIMSWAGVRTAMLPVVEPLFQRAEL